jgi:hypothetical protein
MRRFIILLLLCVLPLQFSLAASADALMHAGGGHHHEASPHSHVLSAGSTADSAVSDDVSRQSHSECGVCHCLLSLAMPNTRADLANLTGVAVIARSGPIAAHRSAATERPERPNWSALV